MAEVTNRFEHLDRESAKHEYLEYCRNMDPAMFPAQDVLLRGALDALNKLLQFGVTEENCRQMADDTVFALGMLHGTAKLRNIALPDFMPADAGRAN